MTNINNSAIISALQAASAQSNTSKFVFFFIFTNFEYQQGLQDRDALLAAMVATQIENPASSAGLNSGTQGPQLSHISSNIGSSESIHFPFFLLSNLSVYFLDICPTCVCPHGASIEAAPTAWYAVFVGRATGVFSSL